MVKEKADMVVSVLCRPNSLFFLVVGTTGSGKSTFISTCARKKLKIGHDLQSCKIRL